MANILKSKFVTVSILKEGYAYLDSQGWMHANASCTVIQSPESVVIVDTLTPWDGTYILQKLAELAINPDAVSHVVSTHGHSDHNGNNNLFLNAKYHIVGYCVSNRDIYYAHPFEHDEAFIIDRFIKIIPTPGHTSEDVSVLVNLSSDPTSSELTPANTLVIAGDLFEAEEDIFKAELWTANSHNPKVQAKNRLKVLKLGNYIIPGHGKMFQVKKEHLIEAEVLEKKYEQLCPNT